ncbi:MAG TPA: exodeoxyribonuclease III [Acidimicrobiaceae bacterium]|nr:exodeoxyribonuclease III [Acidimicrobiaceae bacterium]HCB36664.1 exodeoxyribonuclease III [Acidimicrobiaceae bacterium]
MRVATWNVNSLRARMERVEEWLAYAEPDVALLQETKLADDKFPAGHFAAAGYESVHHGYGQYNGVAILSRLGVADPVCGFADGVEPDPDARLVSATCGGVRVSSAYVPNGRSPDHDHYRYKLSWLGRLREHLEATADPSEPVLVGGDFNVCPDDRDVWDPENPEPRTHVTAAERDALTAVCDWGVRDVFREHYDADGLFSWWDYRSGDFHQRRGLRIDLLLLTAPLLEAVSFCVMDRNARKGAKPSDHIPVLVDLRLDAKR